MTDSTNTDNRELIESIRKVNKVLHLLVIGLQEQNSRIPTESLFSVAAMLTALADDIRERAATQATNSATAQRAAKPADAGRLLNGAVVQLRT